MTFVRWRQQPHIGLALQQLAQGDSVTNIGGDFGYESVSAFISMFRRTLGTTPARYFDHAGSNALERSDRRALAHNRNRSDAQKADEDTGNIISLRRTSK
ncbi:AraC-like DNA-binding protein [Neorhizobium galegae]|uniref:helix-turn-helix domain-containing protein n=1 Tax=Neorhizobium galegae TaxID=399 RepID=UPI001AE55232|nr:AraC-like DNA-binding protein [Neorhizobium galegae]